MSLNINNLPSAMLRKILGMLAPEDQARATASSPEFHKTINEINKDRIEHLKSSKKRTFTHLNTNNPTKSMGELWNLLKRRKTISDNENCRIQPLRKFNLPPGLQEIADDSLIEFWEVISKRTPTIAWPDLPANNDRAENAEFIRKQMSTMRDQNSFSQITQLNLDNTDLSILPSEISYFSALRTLSLANNPIISLPDDLNLPELTTLNLSRTHIKSLPNNLNLPHLQRLSLQETPIILWPDDCNLPELEFLNLSHTQIKSLPNNFHFPRLDVLWLENTPITSLPDDLNLPALTALNLSHAQIKSLPNNFNLPHLEGLALAHTPITSLPDDLNLPELTLLDLSNSQIRTLPNNFHLPRLRSLLLMGTLINSLPDDVILPTLRRLFLTDRIERYSPQEVEET
ncbi:MAG TPA: leucine-rich repeat domain-containing protein [Chlamydiales bacterium]|nr:leucine-rich repeat domain-containing protein [Chlamydiales bacterium]